MREEPTGRRGDEDGGADWKQGGGSEKFDGSRGGRGLRDKGLTQRETRVAMCAGVHVAITASYT
jgi:hypothetical protein